jgi:hypothetical protein
VSRLFSTFGGEGGFVADFDGANDFFPKTRFGGALGAGINIGTRANGSGISMIGGSGACGEETEGVIGVGSATLSEGSGALSIGCGASTTGIAELGVAAFVTGGFAATFFVGDGFAGTEVTVCELFRSEAALGIEP